MKVLLAQQSLFFSRSLTDIHVSFLHASPRTLIGSEEPKHWGRGGVLETSAVCIRIDHTCLKVHCPPGKVAAMISARWQRFTLVVTTQPVLWKCSRTFATLEVKSIYVCGGLLKEAKHVAFWRSTGFLFFLFVCLLSFLESVKAASLESRLNNKVVRMAPYLTFTRSQNSDQCFSSSQCISPPPSRRRCRTSHDHAMWKKNNPFQKMTPVLVPLGLSKTHTVALPGRIYRRQGNHSIVSLKACTEQCMLSFWWFFFSPP